MVEEKDELDEEEDPVRQHGTKGEQTKEELEASNIRKEKGTLLRQKGKRKQRM